MEKADLNVGGILMLPKGFKLAAKMKFPKKLKKKIKRIFHHTVLNSTIYLLLDQLLEKLTKS
jgi:hypothetical protein